jgi:cyclopropane fatty-acyl-phospholipid synthase-like methyltransferase
VLDLGCGAGRWTVWLRHQGFDTAGADFAPNGIRHANDCAADEGLAIPFVCAPVTGRPFPGRRFDAVVAALVLDLVSPGEFSAALEVVRDSLNRGGYLFAVFNPVTDATADDTSPNPTVGVTRVVYSDEELRDRLAAAFSLVHRQNFELGTRGFLWQLVRD